MSKKIPGRKHVTIDRFEGDSKQIAVLIDDDGTPYLRPRTALPEGAKPGDVLKHDLTHDRQATKAVADQTKKIQRSMRREDNGKDIKFPKKSIGDQTSAIQRSMRRKDSGKDVKVGPGRSQSGRWITVHGHHFFLKNK